MKSFQLTTDNQEAAQPAKRFSAVYVYLRFSSDGQADGFSFERQRLAANKSLAAMALPSDIPVHWLEDPGFSAFTGRHARSGELGRFIKSVESGAIKDGLFMCERVSRASRQGSLKLLSMLNLLLDSGFTIKFLEEASAFDKDNLPDFLGTLMAIHADIAYQESKAKSDFARANWDKRRRLAAESGVPFTSECPNWLKVENGRYVPIPERVEAIREIYVRARDGFGISKLVRFANKNQLPVPGKGATWHTSLVNRVLSNQALIGRFQPRKVVQGKRVPFGKPIENYYPVVLDVDLFMAVQSLRAKAAAFPSRRDDNNYNYLMGIAKCECGGSWRRMNKNSGVQAGYALYSCSNRVRGTTNCPNVPARDFDLQFIAFACDKIPAMLMAGEDPTRNRREAIAEELEAGSKQLASLVAFASKNPDLADDTAAAMRDIKLRCEDLAEELRKLDRQQPPPDGFSFDEGIEVFIPAYLDRYPDDSDEANDAFRARALFASRVRASVAAVTVDADRMHYTVELKNGESSVEELGTEGGFAPAEQCVDEDERDEVLKSLVQVRKRGLAVARRMSNGSP